MGAHGREWLARDAAGFVGRQASMSIVVISIVTILVIDLMFHLIAVKVAVPVFEGRPPFRPESCPSNPSFDTISFPTTNKLRLRGTLFRNSCGAARGLIIFCHEFGSNRWTAQHYCEALLQSGFDVFAFDFRNQGDSDELPGYRPLHWLTEYEVEDVHAAIAYVRSQPELKDLPLAMYGMSRGGVASLVAASQEPAIKCLVCDGAYSARSMLQHYIRRWGAVLYVSEAVLRLVPDWHIDLTINMVLKVSQIRQGCRYIDLERALSKLRQPLLMISGERDTYVIPELTHKLHRLTRQNSDSVWIVPGAKHNRARSVATDTYDNRLQRFFAILGPGQFSSSAPAVSGAKSVELVTEDSSDEPAVVLAVSASSGEPD